MRRLGLAATWLAVLLLVAWWLLPRLQLSSDLRDFMPAPQTPGQKLLIDELGEGPGSRLLLVALSGAEPSVLARQSESIRERLAGDERFAVVANGGDAGMEAIPGHLRPYRYLLSPTLDEQQFDAAYLAGELEARLQDLGSPAAGMIEPLLPADPTLESLVLLDQWEPAHAPQRLHGVWFDKTGRQALMLLQTHAAGFDPSGQEAALAALDDAFAEASSGSGSRLLVSGPGAFSVSIGQRTAAEASLLGGLGGLAFVLLMMLAYRSWKAPLMATLPVASAGLAGMVAVAWLFPGGVHGITLAFGFTLIGIAADYPIHLLSHQRPGIPPGAGAKALGRTLGIGVVSTCIAYLSFFAAGVDGLRQLAVFTVVGLATAMLTTRFLLPALLAPATRDVAGSRALSRLHAAAWRWPRLGPATVAIIAAVAAAVALLAPGPFWQNDLSRLTPVPEDSLELDARLRGELGAPDVRYLLTVEGSDVEAVLQASEELRPVLDDLRRQGAIEGYDLAARYLPSVARQRERQARLPDGATLASALDEALADSPFRPDVFAPFLADVGQARVAAPLRPADLEDSMLHGSVSGLLLDQGDKATALVSLSGPRDPAAVAAAVEPLGAHLLDLKQASESLVAAYRERVLWALAAAVLLLVVAVSVGLREPRRVARVLAPMLVTGLVVVAVLRVAGVELNLFHLVSLILAAGLGLDYALFFDHAGSRREEQLRTVHAIGVCSLTTLSVFALLASSQIPVLRAIGVTVALGVACNLLGALLIARHRPPGQAA